ncbi:MAG: 16S rRNA (cytosine(1402)-N(4))-methyltransferase RsmH [Patescibacteria group bacterium]
MKEKSKKKTKQKAVGVVMENRHKSVLLQEVLRGLALRAGDTALDATLGGGGHAEDIAKAIGKKGTLVGLDADRDAVTRAEIRLAQIPAKARPKLILRESNFRHLADVLEEEGISGLDGALFDLGWSQNQLELSGRGFSFQRDEPLLMTYRMDIEKGLTAYEMVNKWPQDELAQILREYGEEKFSGRIARGIVEERRQKTIETTGDLVRAVEKYVPDFYRSQKIHAATRTFQALRIAVNEEFVVLEEALGQGFDALRPGGRLAVISFHSGEDRIVKHFFKKKVMAGYGRLFTKKPLEAEEGELKENPRSRSAKLRVIIKTHTHDEHDPVEN